MEKQVKELLNQLWENLDKKTGSLNETIEEYQSSEGDLDMRSVETIKELVDELRDEISLQVFETRDKILKCLGE